MPLACLWRTRSSVLGQLHLRPNALAAAGWGAVSLGVTLHTVLHVAPVEVCPCGPASSLPHQYGSCAACIAIDIAAACGGIVTERLGEADRWLEEAHRRRYDAPAPLAWDQGEMSSREIAHDSDDGVEQAARSCEPTATRAFGVSAIWMDRTFCYACCPPLLTLKDNLHSRCAAISDYPSRPSSPADRWLYLLIGPLNLLGWRAPRAASGAPEAHRHTTPASALKQAHRAGCRSGESQVVS